MCIFFDCLCSLYQATKNEALKGWDSDFKIKNDEGPQRYLIGKKSSAFRLLN